MVPPGAAVAGPVLVIATSALGLSSFWAVAVLLAAIGSATPAGGATVTALLRLPGAALGSTVATAVNVTEPPGGMVTKALIHPLPVAGQLAPAPAAHVHVGLISSVGKLSTTCAPFARLGPAFVTTMV
jgi:hypothetical protein